eukprot:CAMPEP_0174829328 /NCGR_PEP_ID=MMETSP1114-20130205/1872_1 /TAXON_ID=312471 /ORGANISM="Neobodo designis, Strain CCAP 1951/1" /LENGTH=212 /DNA_ID=CAMNT_0016063071 /DNA_START=43 /DNA_END=681 /DNA_ORIENTATION=+
MASPFVAARVNDLAVEAQVEEGGPFYAVITIAGIDPLPLAHATDDDFVVSLAELLQMAGVRDTDSFAEGEKITAELEDPDTNEIEEKTLVCTAAKLAIAKANPQQRSKAPEGADDEENAHMADMDDAANHAHMEEMKAQQKKRMATGLTAEALNSIIKMAKANGLAQEHIDQCFVAAGGILPTDADRERFENDEEENEAAGGGPQGQQCPQQ